jgi:hypothetical protein
MTFINILEQHKQKIIDQWFDRIVNTYPKDTSRFLQKEQDPFANPVGNVTLNSIEELFNQLLREKTDPQFLKDHIDPILRIRAIQNFYASDAVGFILDLKPIVRKMMRDQKITLELNDYVAFEMRVDQLVLYAFDIFMSCKEKIYDLKANEVRNQSFEALERANLLKPDKTTA